MEIRATALPEVKILTPRRFRRRARLLLRDLERAAPGRGRARLRLRPGQREPVGQAGTLRGLHYQAPPFAQAKLVRVAQGAILDVAVDARRGSPTYGRWVAEEISAANGAQILVPRGFLHGFVTLTDDTLVIYKVDNVYDAASDGGRDLERCRYRHRLGRRRRGTRSCRTRTARAPAFRDWASPFEYGVGA